MSDKLFFCFSLVSAEISKYIGHHRHFYARHGKFKIKANSIDDRFDIFFSSLRDAIVDVCQILCQFTLFSASKKQLLIVHHTSEAIDQRDCQM